MEFYVDLKKKNMTFYRKMAIIANQNMPDSER